MTIEVDASRVQIRGIISSSAHAAILEQSAHRYFADKEAVLDLQIRPALPPGWALITDMSLRALAQTRTASAEITAAGVTVRGVTGSAADWQGAADLVDRNLLPGMLFRQQVVEIAHDGSLERQCIELFRTAQRGHEVEFALSSATLRTSALPTLDELIQIATDCPTTMIDITGHTDSTGDEAANLYLSQARADAVAAYLHAGGIASSRITAVGVGSNEPLVRGNGSRARQLNRRIDIELRFP